MPQIYTQQPRDDSIIWRLEARDIVEQIEHHLKGEFLVDKEITIDDKLEIIQEWTADPAAAVMNDQGVKSVVSLVQILVNKVTFLSNLDDDEIIDVCRDMHLAIARDVYNNWNDYGINKQPGPIINEIMTLVFVGFKRAMGAGERTSLYALENINRNIHEGGSGGGWNIPLIGKRGGQEQ